MLKMKDDVDLKELEKYRSIRICRFTNKRIYSICWLCNR